MFFIFSKKHWVRGTFASYLLRAKVFLLTHITVQVSSVHRQNDCWIWSAEKGNDDDDELISFWNLVKLWNHYYYYYYYCRHSTGRLAIFNRKFNCMPITIFLDGLMSAIHWYRNIYRPNAHNNNASHAVVVQPGRANVSYAHCEVRMRSIPSKTNLK